MHSTECHSNLTWIANAWFDNYGIWTSRGFQHDGLCDWLGILNSPLLQKLSVINYLFIYLVVFFLFPHLRCWRKEKTLGRDWSGIAFTLSKQKCHFKRGLSVGIKWNLHLSSPLKSWPPLVTGCDLNAPNRRFNILILGEMADSTVAVVSFFCAF